MMVLCALARRQSQFMQSKEANVEMDPGNISQFAEQLYMKSKASPKKVWLQHSEYPLNGDIRTGKSLKNEV